MPQGLGFSVIGNLLTASWASPVAGSAAIIPLTITAQ